MKFCAILLVSFSAAWAGDPAQFTGSTPAGKKVREFLGIPAADSVDFIRWNLVINSNSYQLTCNYGIGKPNTNGFLQGGYTLNLTGGLTVVNNEYRLACGNRELSVLRLNNNLLHFLDNDHNLMVGNAGWSYTLNNLRPVLSSELAHKMTFATIADSLEFVGRTPCGIPGVMKGGGECYKLKWRVVLYSRGEYFLNGTALNHKGSRGRYQIMPGGGRTTFVLLDADGKPYLKLLRLDKGVVIFTDVQGNLLVGDLDFSYTLNLHSM